MGGGVVAGCVGLEGRYVGIGSEQHDLGDIGEHGEELGVYTLGDTGGDLARAKGLFGIRGAC